MLLLLKQSLTKTYSLPPKSAPSPPALPLPAPIAAYVDRVCALSGVKQWMNEARAEKDFLDFEEPYRLSAAAPAR